MKTLFLALFLVACSSPEDKALRSGQYSMHPTNSPRVNPPMVGESQVPADRNRLVPDQPERSDALTKEGYNDVAPGGQAPGAPEDLHDVAGTRMQSDRGRLHTMGAAPGVSNPTDDQDKHNADINREKDKSRAGD